MKKLLIIGNGFDIMHGLKTSYCDFKEYLEKKYNVKDDVLYGMCPYSTMGNHGEEYYDINEQAQYLYQLFMNVNGYNWNNLEDSMADFDFKEDLYDVNLDEEKFMHDVYNNEDGCSNIVQLFSTNFHKELLKEWLIETIDYSKVIKNQLISSIINDDCIILSFNYTKTIELIYGINDVIHIHGLVDDDYKDLVFGFFEEYSYQDIDDANIGAHYTDLEPILKKNVSEIISRYYTVFEKIRNENIDEVYTIGFGYGKCDLKYIEMIIGCINQNRVSWYIKSKDISSAKIKENLLRNRFNYTGNIILL